MKWSMYKLLFALTILAFWQCRPAEGNRTGTEYMPDMAHSIAYEANVNSYYFYHSWGSKEEIAHLSAPRFPVTGTKARGSMLGYDTTQRFKMLTGDLGNNAIATPANGGVPYYYGNTEEERARASKEITSNPVPVSAKGLESGKYLYDVYCGICHGAAGDGAGYLVRDDGGKYPAQPANFLKDEFIAANEGRFYHAIMYGRNVMGSYKDKLSYMERWNVIHYIRSLQATSKKLIYNEKENTFSNSAAVEASRKAALAAAAAAAPAPAPAATK